MTSNFQLENYINSHKSKFGMNNTFLGVFSADNLPHPKSFSNGYLIINYSDENQKGTHWIGMRNLNSIKEPEYFDSYGLAPDKADVYVNNTTDFKDYLIQNSRTGQYNYNKIDVQSWKEGDDECGEYCLVFLMYGLPDDKNPVWAKFLREQNKQKRDEMVKRFIGIRK